jgi:hypothetical protein
LRDSGGFEVVSARDSGEGYVEGRGRRRQTDYQV